MNDSLTPDWIKQRAAEVDRNRTKRESDANAKALAEVIVRTEGPRFWCQLVNEIGHAVANVNQLDLNGMASPYIKCDFETHCRVQISSNSICPKITYTDLFYATGSNVIRCHTVEMEAFPLAFRVVNGDLGVFANNQPPLLTPDGAARFVVERMIDRVQGDGG